MSNATSVWVWVGHMGLTDRVQLALEHYGDRMTDVSIFGWSVMRTGELIETFDPRQLDQYRQKWPHLRFWLCFRNMDGPDAAEVGPRVIFDALRDSTTAQQRLAREVGRIFDQYPWLHGVDIDLESGGNDRSEESEQIFRRVADAAHATGRECAAALPPLTATGSVGGENWVRYRPLGQILDRVEIMSYDFAWSGSAPGPISPGWWLEEVYDWVTSQIEPGKVHMGIPLYVYYWRLHDYPPELGQTWRGLSGTFYSFWQQLAGYPWYDDRHPLAGWVAYRDQSSKSLWAYLHAYDWHTAHNRSESSGITFGTYQGREYLTRYGQPSGSPLWSVADNSASGEYADFWADTEPVIDTNGRPAFPYNGYTLTVEHLQREPVAATIVDDYITSEDIWADTDRWEVEEPWEGYRQYRGTGPLEYAHDFGDRSLYVQARGQFTQEGTFTIYTRGIRVELRNDGRIRATRDGEVLEVSGGDQANPVWVGALPITPQGRGGQFVLGVRVREDAGASTPGQSVRVYFSRTEEGVIPEVFAYTTTRTDLLSPGRTGFDAGAEVLLDHLYLGDGWWYQPREAISVAVAGERPRVVGRRPRSGVTWDERRNMFRPNLDTNEMNTRDAVWTEYSSLDWGYHHVKDLPIRNGTQFRIRVEPVDHDVWVGNLIVFDREVGIIAYCNDVEAVAHWRSRADHDWGLAGVAMWSLGQEDVRLWETFAAAELPASTKRLNE